jgi:hypothetical protein
MVGGKPLEQVLGVPRDFASQIDGKDAGFRFIHRRDGDADIYFVANPADNFAAVQCTFRVSGKAPELWHPDSGAMEPAGAYSMDEKTTTVPIRFDPCGSVFVVFRNAAGRAVDPIASVKQGEVDVLLQATASPQDRPKLEIRKATYGVPDGKPEQQIDLTDKIAAMVKDGALAVRAGNDLAGSDPAKNVPKKLAVEYTIDGKAMSKAVAENVMLQLPDDVVLSAHPAAELKSPAMLQVWERGEYTITTAGGRTMSARVTDLPRPVEVAGMWEVRFPPNLGAPESIQLNKLIPLNEHADEGVKHFSGTATYTRAFDVSGEMLGAGRRVYLDLGLVKNLAEVTVNGKNLATLWKPPFRVDITDAVWPGTNQLDVKVTNLWPNRLIGDAGLPPEQRVTWTAFDAYKKDSPLLPSGLIGPVKLVPTAVVELK